MAPKSWVRSVRITNIKAIINISAIRPKLESSTVVYEE